MLPFLDADMTYCGCTIVLAHGMCDGQTKKVRQSHINLLDTEKKNNLLSYKSEVVAVGQKKFELAAGDQDDFILVITAVLNRD